MAFSNLNTFTALPMIALRGIVLFPGMLLHFDAGRERSIAALNSAMKTNKEVLLVTQREMMKEDPEDNDLYFYGCTAKIRQLLKLNDGGIRVLVEGKQRASITSVISHEPYLVGEYITVPDTESHKSDLYKEATIRHVKQLFEEYLNIAPQLPMNVVMTIRSSDNCAHIADFLASNLPIDYTDKQAILEQTDPVKRCEDIAEILEHEIQVLNIDVKIAEKVKVQMDENQKDYYLREQVKAINEELYGEDDPHEEAEEYAAKIHSLNADNSVKEKLFKEVDKLEKMPFGSQEATVVRNYLDACIELPWGAYTTDKTDIKKASAILEREHYGLEKVKERILEALAVNSLTGKVSGSILCLVGPPGVGKTSIARSVAHCMGRKFQRISLGGVHDEAEIRGHRRTYIGSMPGRIMDAVKLAGSANPVILLDEIDKLGSDYKGDPSSALLEALDPEQNSTFKDHFIDMPFDLSRVLFLTTANDIQGIPGPLYDRMEIIDISGYTREDKFNIAKKYLVKKQLAKNGLTAKNLKITSGAVYALIDRYTREAGVRKLEQAIGTLCRKAAVKLVSGEDKSITVNINNLKDYLGPEKFKDDTLLPFDEVGVVNGLAWTAVGGTLLQVEASVLDGSGKVELTGSLGDVMKESGSTALSYVRSISDKLLLSKDFYSNCDFHINATEGAIPKDGPSAGITMTVALVSALTGIPVKRDVAMTGEITLRGRILPIGGLKEKTMAAYTSGIKTVFVPKANVPDLEEIDPKVKENVEIIPVSDAWEVIEQALTRIPEKKRITDICPPDKTVRNNTANLTKQ